MLVRATSTVPYWRQLIRLIRASDTRHYLPFMCYYSVAGQICLRTASAHNRIRTRVICILPGYLSTEPCGISILLPMGKILCLSIDMGFCLRAKGYLYHMVQWISIPAKCKLTGSLSPVMCGSLQVFLDRRDFVPTAINFFGN